MNQANAIKTIRQPLAIRPGVSLIWCSVCLKEGKADFNASRNIPQRLVVRCQQPRQQTLQTLQEKPPTRLLAGEM